MVKFNRIFWRSLIFITLGAAAFSFIIGLSWLKTQPTMQTVGGKDATPQTSTPIIIRPQTDLNPADRKAGNTQRFLLSPKQSSATQSPSLNPELLADKVTPSTQATQSPQVEEVSSGIASLEQLATNFSAPKEFQAKIIEQVKLVGQEKAIALTFDDGPWPSTTFQVLDILEKNNIKATFFWVGQYLQYHPQIAQKVVAKGHAIGNHTWHHSYRHFNQTEAAYEIDATAELIYKTTGVTTSLFRPPGGLLNNGVVDYAKKKKYVTVMWSDDPMDYRPLSAQKLVNNVIRKAHPGAIVLMHDGGGDHAATVKALPQIIVKLKKLGYSFVTVPELLEMRESEQLGIMAKTKLSDSPLPSVTNP